MSNWTRSTSKNNHFMQTKGIGESFSADCDGSSLDSFWQARLRIPSVIICPSLLGVCYLLPGLDTFGSSWSTSWLNQAMATHRLPSNPRIVLWMLCVRLVMIEPNREWGEGYYESGSCDQCVCYVYLLLYAMLNSQNSVVLECLWYRRYGRRQLSIQFITSGQHPCANIFAQCLHTLITRLADCKGQLCNPHNWILSCQFLSPSLDSTLCAMSDMGFEVL